MKLIDVLKIEHLAIDLEVDSKNDCITQMVNLLKNDDRILDIDVVLNTVLEREKIMSTGVGNGFAIPHGKTDAVNTIIAAFVRLKNPIDFEAFDGEPVKLAFLLLGKENMVGPHIRLLSRISRMMNKEDFRQSLLDAQSSEEIYKMFVEEEKKIL